MAITALLILDGFGYNPDRTGNAIATQGAGRIRALMDKYPHTLINASGLAVGLPEGQMGNSEVGHLNIGAGRIVYQELTRITKSIGDGDFFEKEEFLSRIENVKKNHSKLHLMGLLSDGGVHSHIEHLYALIDLAQRQGLEQVYVHCFLDGRDVPPASGKGYVEQLSARMAEKGYGKIATVTGRYWAMDRDNRWERVKRAYDALVWGEGNTASDPVEALQACYDREEYDEFVQPIVILENGAPVAKIEDNDSVIFFNFRPDRARELTRALTEPDFDGFDRRGQKKLAYTCMTQYDATFSHVAVAFKPQVLTNTFGQYLAARGMRQLRIAETEKYAHVTFFFNGGVEQPNEGEDRALIPSPKVATYDLQPEMSAYLVTEEACKRIASEKYDVMILNFANCDMVGHTGVMDAAVKAVETVDECIGKIMAEVAKHPDTVLLVTADHGNADCMFDEQTGKVNTAHTTNPVPFVVCEKGIELKPGRLADIAPTILHLLGLEQPKEMTGKCLINS